MGVTRKQFRKKEKQERQKIVGMAVFAMGLCVLSVFLRCNEPADAGAAIMLMTAGLGLFVSKKSWLL